jgi:hypothetical protein
MVEFARMALNHPICLCRTPHSSFNQTSGCAILLFTPSDVVANRYQVPLKKFYRYKLGPSLSYNQDG